MVRKKKLLIALAAIALVAISFFALRANHSDAPFIQPPPGFALIHEDRPMSTLELAALSRHERFAATASRWLYEGPGNYKAIADQVEAELLKLGRWSRHVNGDSILFIGQGPSRNVVKVSRPYRYGPINDKTSIEMMGPLQEPGLVEKMLAIFPVDNFVHPKR